MKRISFTYARWFERLFANLIDTMILLVPSGVLASAFGDAKGPLLMALFTLNIGYGVGFLSSNWQATPGKRLLGIYVIHADIGNQRGYCYGLAQFVLVHTDFNHAGTYWSAR